MMNDSLLDRMRTGELKGRVFSTPEGRRLRFRRFYKAEDDFQFFTKAKDAVYFTSEEVRHFRLLPQQSKKPAWNDSPDTVTSKVLGLEDLAAGVAGSPDTKPTHVGNAKIKPGKARTRESPTQRLSGASTGERESWSKKPDEKPWAEHDTKKLSAEDEDAIRYFLKADRFLQLPKSILRSHKVNKAIGFKEACFLALLIDQHHYALAKAAGGRPAWFAYDRKFVQENFNLERHVQDRLLQFLVRMGAITVKGWRPTKEGTIRKTEGSNQKPFIRIHYADIWNALLNSPSERSDT